jgi:hypothetical protein
VHLRTKVAAHYRGVLILLLVPVLEKPELMMDNENDTSQKEPVIASAPAGPEQKNGKRLRSLLIFFTSAAALGCLLTVVFAIMSSMALPLGIGPSTEINTYYTLQGWVCGGTVVVIGLLSAGTAGGWLAYRKNHTRLAVILSLSPFILIILICTILTLILGLEVFQSFLSFF